MSGERRTVTAMGNERLSDSMNAGRDGDRSGFLNRLLYPLVPRPDKRVALVIGINDYDHLRKLENPSLDAAAISEQLEWAGYQNHVAQTLDASGTEHRLDKVFLEKTIVGFLTASEGADMVVIHYSGHGLQLDGENFLVPQDFDPDIDWRPQLVSVAELITKAGARAKNTVVLLDACRDDGQASATGGDAVRASGEGQTMRAVGLANPDVVVRQFKNENEGSASGGHIVIKLAANPGEWAKDGEAGGLSPFSAAVADHIAARGLTLGEFYTRIRARVVKDTEGYQHPWMSVAGDTNVQINRPNWRELWLFTIAAALLGAIAAFFRHTLETKCGALVRVDSLKDPIYFLNSAWIASLLALAAVRWGCRSVCVFAGAFVIHFVVANLSGLVYADIYKEIVQARAAGGGLPGCAAVANGEGQATYLFYFVLWTASLATIAYGLSFPLSGVFVSRGMRDLKTYVLLLGPVVLTISIIWLALVRDANDHQPDQLLDYLRTWGLVALVGGIMHALFVGITAQAYIRAVPDRVRSRADT